ncbi:hypothetical protein N9B14_02185 [Akkermansiaceae bacterium]|nr:hypothetical protein [Akkermansiaceae bacterium]
MIAGYREIFGISRGLSEVFGQWFVGLFALGIIHLALLLVLSRFAFFKVKPEQKTDLRKVALIIPVFVMVAILHAAVASGTSPY